MSLENDQVQTERKRFVYVAGPMRGYDEYNFPMFDYAQILGQKLGYTVISPADMDRDTGFDPDTTPVDRDFMRRAIRRDLNAIQALQPEDGDFVVALPGFSDSVGASTELAVASWLGLPIRDARSFLDVPPATPTGDSFFGTAWDTEGRPISMHILSNGMICARSFDHPMPDRITPTTPYPPRVTAQSTPEQVAGFLLGRLNERSGKRIAPLIGKPKTVDTSPPVGVLEKFEELLDEKLCGHPRFYEILLDMARLHSRKNHDYAGSEHPLSNFHMTDKMGMEPWKGVVVRLGDKWSRLAAFARSNVLAVKDESVVDTFTDNAVYSILGRILYEDRND